MTIFDRIRGLEEQYQNKAKNAMKVATMRAIEAAENATPPEQGGKLRGVNTITGRLKAAWQTDSDAEPKNIGGVLETTLANNVEYASYVNDGHRLDKHFVPGLYIDESGLISKNTNGEGGIVVGTKTQYVPGLYMTDKAREEYEKTIKELL